MIESWILQLEGRGRLRRSPTFRGDANRHREYFWSRWVQDRSAENVRFLTGVQRVTTTELADREVRVTRGNTGQATEHATSTTSAAEGGLGQRAELSLSAGTVERVFQ